MEQVYYKPFKGTKCNLTFGNRFIFH